MQNCKVCGTTKPLEEYYKNDRTCKVCRRGIVKAHRAANLDRIQAYDRGRGQSPERKKKVKEQYDRRMSTEEGRKKASENSKRNQNKNLLKRAARVIVGNSVRDGKLIKEPCEVCGDTDSAGHHEDYTKPLEVTWLCLHHHGERHREINEEIRNGIDWTQKGWL